MSSVAANVNVAITGAVYASAAGSTVTAPTTAISSLDADLADLGYISDDGVEENYDEDTTEITAWQGGAVIRRVISSSEATFKFAMLENKREVVELYHKGSTVVTDGSSGWKMDIMTPQADRRAFVIDVLDGSDHLRIYIPDGEVTERESIGYTTDGAIIYGVTITAYPNNGLVATKFTDKASWATS